MSKHKYSVRVGNVYFLSRIGLSLRWATEGTAAEELAPDVRHLLARLDQLEAMEAQAAGDAGEGDALPERASPDNDAAV